MPPEAFFYPPYLLCWLACLTLAGVRGWLTRENVLPLFIAWFIATIFGTMGMFSQPPALEFPQSIFFELVYVPTLAILYALFRRRLGLKGSFIQYVALIGSVLPLGIVSLFFLYALLSIGGH